MWVGSDTWKCFTMASRGKVSAIIMKAIIVILDVLRQVERLHICGEKKRLYILE